MRSSLRYLEYGCGIPQIYKRYCCISQEEFEITTKKYYDPPKLVKLNRILCWPVFCSCNLSNKWRIDISSEIIQKESMMNDNFLKILIRQRHEQIMAEYRGSRLPQPEWPTMICWMNHILRLFLPAEKNLDSNQAPILDERSGTWNGQRWSCYARLAIEEKFWMQLL